MKTALAYYHSEIGLIEVAGTANAIFSVRFVDQVETESSESSACIQECVRQLEEYFHGTRQEFSVETILQGTEFQKLVWEQLTAIPYGRMVSYLDIATAIGKPSACRAVGNANMKNNIAIIIPCHRVIGSNGHLTGYGGGLWRKEWLLKHEKAYLL